jgi:hypothetical protein
MGMARPVNETIGLIMVQFVSKYVQFSLEKEPFD